MRVAFGSPGSRRLLLTMVGFIVALDVVFIGIYYALDVEHRPQQVQFTFVIVWTLLTLAVCAVYLRRIRRIRDAAVRAARTRV